VDGIFCYSCLTLHTVRQRPCASWHPIKKVDIVPPLLPVPKYAPSTTRSAVSAIAPASR